MIYNVNDLFVEVNEVMFPACNIQVYPCYPELHWASEHNQFYGVYFELMFENGVALTITQEAANVSMGNATTGCGEKDQTPLDHFIVEVTSMKDRHHKVDFAFHCVGEEDLADVLKMEKVLNNMTPLEAIG